MLFAGRYELLAELGRGGMGKVYRARDHRVMGREVALKVMRTDLAESPAAAERFIREVAVSSRLEHPHTVRVYDFGQTTEGELYLAMQLIVGRSLAALLEERCPLDVERVVHIAKQVARGLMAAHAQAIVHRDLKPANIMIGARPDEPVHATLVDFGIATVAGLDRLTRSGMITGSAPYCSPEQVEGKLPGPAGDIYSLGVVMYEALTGVPCWHFEESLPYLVAHVQRIPEPPSTLNPFIPPWLDELVLSMLEKDPGRRPASAAAVLEALRRRHPTVRVAGTGSTTVPATRPVITGASPTTGVSSLARTGRRGFLTALIPTVVAAGVLLSLVAGGSGDETLESQPYARVELPDASVAEPSPAAPSSASEHAAIGVDRAEPEVVATPEPMTDVVERTEAAPTDARPTRADLAASVDVTTPREPQPSHERRVVARDSRTPSARPENRSVLISITSTPTKAMVYDATTSEPLGRTPLQMRASEGDRLGPFQLRKEAHRSKVLDAGRCCDKTVFHVTLTEI